MDRVDLLIIVFLISAVFRGLKSGLFQLALSTIGFIGGLLIGSQLSVYVLNNASTSLTKLVLALIIELGCALVLSAVGELLGQKLNNKFVKLHINVINEIAGAVFEIIAVLFIVWIVAPSVSDIQSGNVGYYVQRSFIVKHLDSILPVPPDFIARLEQLISPNGFPNVFIGLEPSHTTIAANNTVNEQLVVKDEPSVVEVAGTGCGGVVEGSGFVYSSGIVVTNAHVVAGIKNPKVIDQFGDYNAQTIWFDPNMDLAVLKVAGLNEPALTISTQALATGSSAVSLGFPGGGPLVLNKAVIIDEINAQGRNIYNQGEVTRSIYEIESNVEPGNSGGPLVGPNGEVDGIVFAKSVSQKNLGYALSINQLIPSINQARAHQSPVSDGACSEY